MILDGFFICFLVDAIIRLRKFLSFLSVESLYHERVLGFVKYCFFFFFASIEMIMYILCFNQLKN